MEGRTSLFISHRLASTRFCDRILLLEDGTIIEQGNHEELLEQKDFIISYITASLLIKKVLCHLGRIGICSDYKKNTRAYTEWNDAPDFMCVWLKLSRTHVRIGAFD